MLIHPCVLARNYLRVRGEYLVMKLKLLSGAELPPRARRILIDAASRFVAEGTTSACAENTLDCFSCVQDQANYLRVRGEYDAAPGGEHAE